MAYGRSLAGAGARVRVQAGKNQVHACRHGAVKTLKKFPLFGFIACLSDTSVKENGLWPQSFSLEIQI
jgi:hypothetical protein